ncbi:hypothetical protein ISCGN_002018 [Ixodes scapularis]
MCSVGAVKTAASGRGISVSGSPDDYQVILPPLPNGYVVTNAVFLHCDVKGRPYKIQDFRQELQRLDVMKDLAAAGPHQMNHVWLLRLHSLAAKQRLVDAKELTVKGGRCLVIDPASLAVTLKLHWVPYDVPNVLVKKELERYGKLADVTRERFREKGFEAVESNTRIVRLTLQEGNTVDSLPHELRLEGCKVLVVVPGRAPLCLRCRRKGHIRRDCRIPRCSDCHRYGHDAEDCVKTYATMARDRSEDDHSDFLMDVAEAEEAVGGSSPHLPSPPDNCGSPAPASTSPPATAAPRYATEATPSEPGTMAADSMNPTTPKTDVTHPAAREPKGAGDSGSDGAATKDLDEDTTDGQPPKRLRDSLSPRKKLSQSKTPIQGLGTPLTAKRVV